MSNDLKHKSDPTGGPQDDEGRSLWVRFNVQSIGSKTTLAFNPDGTVELRNAVPVSASSPPPAFTPNPVAA